MGIGGSSIWGHTEARGGLKLPPNMVVEDSFRWKTSKLPLRPTLKCSIPPASIEASIYFRGSSWKLPTTSMESYSVHEHENVKI